MVDMTATDELRRLLDERGVEWKAPSSYDGSKRYDTVAGGYWFHEFDGKITIHGLTPAQAIAATLGAGMCHLKPWEMERDTGFYDSMECDCGYVADVADWASWHFCPSCGRQNVGVDE